MKSASTGKSRIGAGENLHVSGTAYARGVWVPGGEHEALRDLVRAREAAKKDELRAKHRLSKYLLRNGQYPDIWFHDSIKADDHYLYDFTCHALRGGRGLSIGHVFDTAGKHVATINQEVLVRRGRG